ncbi:MAG: hypothetical protein WD355_08005 [Balneolaceae bacterium]
MKPTIILNSLLLSFCLFQATSSLAQGSLEELAPEEYFDFWLGSWELTWEDSDGTLARGTNQIERILNQRVIREQFNAVSGAYEGYTGESYSVYQAASGTWKQTWVDNSGGYLDFTGEFDGDRRMFTRTALNPEGEQSHQRMVFYDITDDSFTWDWELSVDDGETWELRWRIQYERSDNGEDSPDSGS